MLLRAKSGPCRCLLSCTAAKRKTLCDAKVGKESQRGRAAGATLVQSAPKEAGETEGTYSIRNNGIIIVIVSSHGNGLIGIRGENGGLVHMSTR